MSWCLGGLCRGLTNMESPSKYCIWFRQEVESQSKLHRRRRQEFVVHLPQKGLIWFKISILTIKSCPSLHPWEPYIHCPQHRGESGYKENSISQNILDKWVYLPLYIKRQIQSQTFQSNTPLTFMSPFCSHVVYSICLFPHFLTLRSL